MNNYDFVERMPGLVIAKDIHSTYLHISQDFAKLLGWKNSLDCQGVTDHEIPCSAAKFANEFIKLDKSAIISKTKMVALDIQNYSAGWKMVLVERNPIINSNGECSGLFNQCIDVTDCNIFRPYLLLHQLDDRYSGKSDKPKSYILSNEHTPLPLTEKQEQCLFLLVRGKSQKEIAQRLAISARTVESHLEAIKLKLNCNYKSDLIAKAIDSGFLYFIPKEFQSNRLEKITK